MKLLNIFLNIPIVLRLVRLFLSKETNQRIEIAILRQNLTFFGLDCSDMSDEEVIETISKTAKVMSYVGVTADEAAQALRALSI